MFAPGFNSRGDLAMIRSGRRGDAAHGAQWSRMAEMASMSTTVKLMMIASETLVAGVFHINLLKYA